MQTRAELASRHMLCDSIVHTEMMSMLEKAILQPALMEYTLTAEAGSQSIPENKLHALCFEPCSYTDNMLSVLDSLMSKKGGMQMTNLEEAHFQDCWFQQWC